jgi:hypothetical protein
MGIRTLGVLGIVGLLSSSAGAGTLATPLTSSNGATSTGLACEVTNVGTKPTTVASVQLFDFNGNVVALDGTTCPVPPAMLDANASCTAFKIPFKGSGHCSATASGKFRLSIELFDAFSNNTLAVVPGSK